MRPTTATEMRTKVPEPEVVVAHPPRSMRVVAPDAHFLLPTQSMAAKLQASVHT
jgi:hypothetical protein